MPKVSVALPVYNGADLVGRALESARRQTFRDFEILVVDDGSTDDTATVVARFPEVRLIRQPNRGIGATRQRLLEESTGEWIAFLDHDDELLPGMLETLLRASEGVVLVHGAKQVREVNGRSEDVVWSLPTNVCVLDHLLPDDRIANSSVIVRREAMLRRGFPLELSKAEDWLAWFRLAAEGDFAYVPTPISVIHKQTLSASTPNLAWYRAERHVLEDHVLPSFDSWYDRLPVETRERFRAVIRRKLGVIASLEAACLDADGRRSEARTRHREALKAAPTKGAILRYFRHWIGR